MNERVTAERGEHGEVVVMTAWCATCQAETIPHDVTGKCGFCDSQIVDFDTLKPGQVLPQLAAKRHEPPDEQPTATVIPLRAPPEPAKPELRLGNELVLPIEVAGQAIAILAKRGAGKTNTGRVLAEELAAAGVTTVVVDPVGAWWGLRHAADARGRGLDVPVYGGEHGDRPLDSWGFGAAWLVNDQAQSLILDLSDFTRDDQRSFVADFATELYQGKARNHDPIHVILEEADEFAPQGARAGGDPKTVSRCRGAVETLARRGRSRGIGLTMITQRSATLSKDILTQADVLIAMRTTGPTDIKAIEAWISRNAEGGDQVVPSLPSLATGEAWIWAPERGLLKRTMIRLANTFDSSATPEYGKPAVEPDRHELPSAAIPELPAAPTAARDHRDVDEDGLFGCKIPGCTGRSRRRAGALAFLCDVHAGKPAAEPVAAAEQTPSKSTDGSTEPSIPPAPVAAQKVSEAHAPTPGTALVLVEPQPLALGLTGDFRANAARVRAEAERLRAQAAELDLVALSIDRLAELDSPLEDASSVLGQRR
ncbi:MAG TPA: DUF87 domain-containing protein [Gaiellaceae bacterium]|nr:DUF87 domain-containing protein [Gaiellaceae bacterium]